MPSCLVFVVFVDSLLVCSIDLVPSFTTPRSLQLPSVIPFLTFLSRSSRYRMIFNVIYHCTVAFGGGCILVVVVTLLLLWLFEIVHRSVLVQSTILIKSELYPFSVNILPLIEISNSKQLQNYVLELRVREDSCSTFGYYFCAILMGGRSSLVC